MLGDEDWFSELEGESRSLYVNCDALLGAIARHLDNVLQRK